MTCLINEKVNEESKKEISCRLCKLKCSNGRSLHEHVTRLHGGKGLVSQQFISKLKSSQMINNEEDVESVDNNNSGTSELDFDEIDNSFLSSIPDSAVKKPVHKADSSMASTSFSFRKKLPIRLSKNISDIPPPNVAIRVAKVAYYNHKASFCCSTNPFKSAIFSNGGIRGNFFSQERLPLRSCKIKMKITSPSNLTNIRNDKSLSK